MTAPLIIFFVLAALAVFGAVSLILQRHPIHSALSLIVVMVALAGLYLLMGAEFVAAVQIIVYGGAIMVLFIFVIMLLNAGAEQKPHGAWMARLMGAPLLVALLGILSFVILRAVPRAEQVHFGGFTGGTVENVGRAIFTTYLLPFEITSILVLIAIVGAVVLGYKELD